MASYPTQNFTGEGPIWAPYTLTPSFSTITTDDIFVQPSALASFVASGLGTNGISLSATTVGGAGNGNIITQITTDPTGSTIKNVLTTEITATSNASITFEVAAGTSFSTIGSIEFLSSINGVTGGIQIYGGDGEYVSLGAGNASLGNLVGDNGVTVTANSITINPGAVGRPVQLQEGYLDVNNLALSNVSTINGAKYPPGPAGFVQFINSNAPISVSTLANLTTAVPIAYFSTVAGNYYRVTCEFGASNIGGGAATDSSALIIDSENSAVIEFIDSWTVQQSYPPATYQTTASGIMEAAGTWMGVAAINATGSGNVEAVAAYRAWAENLGIPTNQF